MVYLAGPEVEIPSGAVLDLGPYAERGPPRLFGVSVLRGHPARSLEGRGQLRGWRAPDPGTALLGPAAMASLRSPWCSLVRSRWRRLCARRRRLWPAPRP